MAKPPNVSPGPGPAEIVNLGKVIIVAGAVLNPAKEAIKIHQQIQDELMKDVPDAKKLNELDKKLSDMSERTKKNTNAAAGCIE